MLRFICSFGGAAVAALASLIGSAGPADAANSVVASVPVRSDARDLGRAAPGTAISLALTLAYRHAPELDALVDAQSDPASPLFAHYLTNEQFKAYFSPDAQTHARVIAVLERAGFHVAKTYDNRTLLDVTAPAALVERYFGTEIHRVAQAGSGLRYANVKPARLPAELAGSVDGIVGFDNLKKATYFIERGIRAAAIDRGAIAGKLRGPDGGFGPIALANGFDLPVQHKLNGSGRAVANVAGNVADSDVNAFYSYFNIKRTGTINRTIIEGNGTTNPSDPAVAEALLDVEDMGSIAPGATIDLYILENPVDQPGEDAYNQIVSDNLVDAVNSSFGVCETSDESYGAAAKKIVAQGLAKGITFSASSGDGGSESCSSSGKGQNLPAVLPNVVGVGGTSLQVDPKGFYVGEQGWGGSGGGYSANIPLPNYQKGVKTLASQTLRNVPDVSFPADPNTGFSYYAGGAFVGPIGGTSWSSPTFVALQAETNERKGARGGFVNPKIYAAFKKTKYKGFHDILTGSNGSFNNGPGYDNVDGIGSPIGYIFSGLE